MGTTRLALLAVMTARSTLAITLAITLAVAMLAVAMLAAVFVAAGEAADTRSPQPSHNALSTNCPLPAGESVRVARRLSPLIYLLADGRRIRLADLTIGANAPAGQPTLLDQIVGRRLLIAAISALPDRHGAMPVHAWRVPQNVTAAAIGKGTQPSLGWVQERAILSGLALTDPDPDTSATARVTRPDEPNTDRAPRNERSALETLRRARLACLNALIRAERRQSTTPIAAVEARDHKTLRSRTGRFTILRGRVSRVSRGRGHTYLNFGRDWRTDTTVKVSASITRRWPRWSSSLTEFKGRRVEVRGWLRDRNGPLIELAHPAALQRLKSGPGAAADTKAGTTR